MLSYSLRSIYTCSIEFLGLELVVDVKEAGLRLCVLVGQLAHGPRRMTEPYFRNTDLRRRGVFRERDGVL